MPRSKEEITKEYFDAMKDANRAKERFKVAKINYNRAYGRPHELKGRELQRSVVMDFAEHPELVLDQFFDNVERRRMAVKIKKYKDDTRATHCWYWTGKTINNQPRFGLGRVVYPHSIYAKRYILFAVRGIEPQGNNKIKMEIRHEDSKETDCHPFCVNPWHMYTPGIYHMKAAPGYKPPNCPNYNPNTGEKIK